MGDASSIPKTLYELLGTTPGVTRAEIKEAYEKSVVRLQQRIEEGELEALDDLRLLRDAFHILHDPERRQHYDMWIKPQARRDDRGEAEDQSVARETVSWGIVLLLIALALAGVWTYLTLLESASESPIGFASSAGPAHRN